jgi:PmbA protein
MSSSGGLKMLARALAASVVREGQRGGADDVAAICTTEEVKMIRFSNNQVTVAKAWRSSAVSVMLAMKKKVVIGSIEDLSRGSIMKSTDYLLKMAKATRPNRDYVKLPRGPFKYAIFQPSLRSIQSSNLVEHVKSTICSATSCGAKRVAGALLFRNVSTTLETSASAFGEDTTSSLEISVRAFADGDASGHANSCARVEKDFHPEEAGKMAAEIAKKAMNPVEGKPGRYDVVLGPNVFANLVNDVMSAASAFNVDAGLSFLANMLGKKVASTEVTLIDDGTLPDGLNSRIFDDEGIPTRRTVVIDNGTLRSYLHNSSTAKKFKSSTTANAGWIVPQPWNIVVEGGQADDETLLGELDDGIYITNNWYTRFQDYRTGDFSTVCRDGLFRVEGGEITQPFKGLRISENLPRLLKNVSVLSKRRQWIKWWEVEIPTLTPHVLVRDVNLTRATK